MAYVEDLIAGMTARLGRPYWNQDARRLVDSDFPGNDCSGCIFVVAHTLGWSIPTLSWTIARWCHSNGAGLSVEQGLRTRGAFLFMGGNQGDDGYGNDGHIEVSLGNDYSIGSPHTGHKLGIGYARGRRWSGAGFGPGLQAGGLGHPGTTPSLTPAQAAKKAESDMVILFTTDKKAYFSDTHGVSEVATDVALRLAGGGSIAYTSEVSPLVVYSLAQQAKASAANVTVQSANVGIDYAQLADAIAKRLHVQ